MHSTRPLTPPIGLALAGGGAEGAIYEIGALRALDEVLEGLDFNRIPVYVGVSAGAFISACLANHLTTAQLCRALVKTDPGEHPFVPDVFLEPAFAELAHRLRSVPSRFASGLWDFMTNPTRGFRPAMAHQMAGALPVGIAENWPIQAYLEKTFALKGRTDDFRALEQALYIVATDIESGEATLFGQPGRDHIPISQAVQASTALPGLYPPVLIEGRYYADGVLLKTLHASVALERGAQLVIGINPIVPIDTRAAVARGTMRPGALVEHGLSTVLSQTFRTMIHSRMETGLAAYKARFPNADVVLFEPPSKDHEMFFTNIFSFSDRKAICEYAYRATRRTLRDRYEELAPRFARHGIRIRTDLLNDDTQSVWSRANLPQAPPAPSLTQQLRRNLDALNRLLDATLP